MNRRDFFSTSALTGYSVIVNASSLFNSGEERTSLRQPVIGVTSHGVQPEPNMALVDLSCDVFIAGGGMAGVCAALAAARHGAKVLLVQDRSRLGGNASSEVRMHIVGADRHGSNPGWRESGLIEELRLEDAVHNPHRAWELWDLMLYDKCVSEPNLTLFLDSSVYAATTANDLIQEVMVRCDKTEHLYRIKAQIYCDCTGDSRLALESGAEFRVGREAKSEFGESLAVDEADHRTQGSSILFTAREHTEPIPYVPPKWARKITKEHLKFRPVGSWEYGYWWIELGGMYDTIRDNELLRKELLSVVLGVWDYIKNSGDHPSSANWALETVGMIPGKRESRRNMGDHMMTQGDLEGGWKRFHDAVAIGGWALDDHPPEGFDAPEKRPYQSIKLDEPYNIPLGSLYSKNIKNLMMAGRNISSSHVAFSSARVMATTSVIGQAMGTAAMLCTRTGFLPRDLRNDSSRLKELQQILLRDDQSIRNVRNEDPMDRALLSVVRSTATLDGAVPEHVLTGVTRDQPGKWEHRWSSSTVGGKPFIELEWRQPQKIGYVQITFDTGFHRELTLTASNEHNRSIVRGPQPETVRDYTILGRTEEEDGWVELAKVTGNYQRLRRHPFEPVLLKALRIQIHSTNGGERATIYEIRCYEEDPR